MGERVTKAAVVARAREYIGTPFQHQARVQGLGVDCVGLVVSVAEDLGLVDRCGVAFKRNDYPTYSAQPAGGFILDECRRRLVEKPVADLGEADVVTMRIPIEPCHTGITAARDGRLYLIHAYNGGELEVIEHILDAQWRRRIIAAFAFSDVVGS